MLLEVGSEQEHPPGNAIIALANTNDRSAI